MKLHVKRSSIPKTWPVPRKGTAFVIKGNETGIPLVIALRDMLNLARTRREVKKAINKNHLIISNKIVNDDKKLISLFDVLTIVPENKNYRLTFSQTGKYLLEEISKEESTKKLSKIIGKKAISKNKIQLNLLDGRNYICDLKCNAGDSALIDLEKNKISKIIPVKEKSEVLVIGGKHIGEKGKIVKLIPEFKLAEIESENTKFNVLIKQMMVLS